MSNMPTNMANLLLKSADLPYLQIFLCKFALSADSFGANLPVLY